MLQYLQTDVGIKQKHLLQRVGVLYLNIKKLYCFCAKRRCFLRKS